MWAMMEKFRMCFIDAVMPVRPVCQPVWGAKKKGRVGETRPEPTIYGNCDSWDFIVGKTRLPDSPPNPAFMRVARPQQKIHSQLIHRAGDICMNKLWGICGSPRPFLWAILIACLQLRLMP
jgi:hypothetical protein